MEVKDIFSAKNKMKELHSQRSESELELVRKSHDEQLLQDSVRARFWYLNQYFALYHLSVENDYTAARQRFYVAGRMGEYLNNVYQNPWMAHGMFYMYYALLSDHQALIQRYAHLTHPLKNEMNQNAGVFTTVVQNVIAGDWEQLDIHIQTIQNFKGGKLKVVKTIRDRFLTYIDALRNKDLHLLKKAIMSFEEASFKTSMKRGEILYEHLISHHTLGLAKLAWYKGLPVEIDSPYVPREMLPIAPLPHYHDPYHFLEGGQGIAG